MLKHQVIDAIAQFARELEERTARLFMLLSHRSSLLACHGLVNVSESACMMDLERNTKRTFISGVLDSVVVVADYIVSS